jgi:hypothetical protein
MSRPGHSRRHQPTRGQSVNVRPAVSQSVSVCCKETPRGPADLMPVSQILLQQQVSQSVSVRYKETLRGPADPVQAQGFNPCPALVTQGATNLPQVSPTTGSTQAELACNMYKALSDLMRFRSFVRSSSLH